MSKSASISTSLNIIGKTVDEAMPELDKYLDDAYLAHLNQVTIIHGRGTGKLRTAVHNKLKKCRYVNHTVSAPSAKARPALPSLILNSTKEVLPKTDKFRRTSFISLLYSFKFSSFVSCSYSGKISL